MLDRFGFHTKMLSRIRLGNLRLGDLPRGHWRLLTNREIHIISSEPASPARTNRSGFEALRSRREPRRSCSV
jgi:hypothetical protein